MKSMLVAAPALLMLGACHYEFAAVQPNELPIDEKKVGEVKDGDALLQRIRKAVRNKEDLFAAGQVFTPER